MNEHRDKPYIKWGLTALVVIFISILLVVIFTNLPGFFGCWNRKRNSSPRSSAI